MRYTPNIFFCFITRVATLILHVCCRIQHGCGAAMGCFPGFDDLCFFLDIFTVQGGPLPTITGVITPTSRVITPVTHLFSAIYRGPSHPFTTIVEFAPPCQLQRYQTFQDICTLFLVGFPDMDVSENSGTPKSSILIGYSIINHPFWGTSIFGNTHIDLKLNSDFLWQNLHFLGWLDSDGSDFCIRSASQCLGNRWNVVKHSS